MKKLFLALTACTVLFVACDDTSSSPNSENKSSEQSKSCPNADEPLTDARDGKVYRTVKIGDQIWMAENLNYETTSSWTNDSLDKDGSIYGRFYTFGASKNACPEGWHVPTFDEFNELRKNAGGEGLAGKNLKTTSGWDKSEEGKDGNGTDKYCFGIKASGKSWNKEDGVYGVGEFAQLWTSTTFIRPEYDSYGNRIDRGTKVYYFSFTSSDSVYIESYDTTPAWNIRCMKGDPEPEPIAPNEVSAPLSDSLQQVIEQQRHEQELIKIMDSVESLDECDTVEGLTEDERVSCKKRFCSIQISLEVHDACIEQGIR